MIARHGQTMDIGVVGSTGGENDNALHNDMCIRIYARTKLTTVIAFL